MPRAKSGCQSPAKGVGLAYYAHWAPTEDAGAKLACFSTGPAIRNPVANFTTEAIGTFALTFGITNQRETTVVWDRNTGEPIHNALVWQDTRTDKLADELAADGGQDHFRAKVGLPLATYLACLAIAGDLGDQQAASFGQTCYAVGEAKNTYGTGNFLLLNTGHEAVQSKSGLLTTLGYKIGDEDAVYCPEGSIAITGALVQWLRDNLGMIKESSEIECRDRRRGGSLEACCGTIKPSGPSPSVFSSDLLRAEPTRP